MTPKNTANPLEDDSLGMLNAAASLDTSGIGILGGTAQVNVSLPVEEDDALADDGVVEGEIIADLIVDETPVDDVEIGRIHADDIVIEIPADPVVAVPVVAVEPVTAEVVVDIPATDTAAPEAEPVVVAAAKKKPSTSRSKPQTKATSAEEKKPVAAKVVAGQPKKAPAKSVKAAAVSTDETKAAPTPVRTAKKATAKSSTAKITVETAASTAMPAVAEVDVTESSPTASATPATEVAPEVVAETVAPAATATVVETERETSQKERPIVDNSYDKALAPRSAAEPARVRTPEIVLTSKRLDDLGNASRETADLLTADRLLDPHQVNKPEPEGAWSHFLYAASGRRINIGDGKRARARKELTAKIAAPLSGGARFVPVMSRKGGVGKTTITALLGMALADAREDRVIAVDANPDRGTLADRIVRPHHTKSVRDLVRIHDEVRGYHDISAIVARDATRLDVLASDTDPRVSEAFSDEDYRHVAGVAAHYYSLVLTDTGTGIVHSVMSATLDLSDQLIIVSGLSVDEARLASETLTWLETNGYAEQARDAIVVLNQSTSGAPLVRLNELEAHFATRAKHVVRMPYDSQIAGGGTIIFANLQPETRQAARELAAVLVEGLRLRTL